LTRLVVEFSPIDDQENAGKLFVQTNPLKQVHIIDMSVSKLSTTEGLILLHLLSGADGDVITIRSLRNVIVCKIMAVVRIVIHCNRSVNQSFGWMGQTRALASLHSSTSSLDTTLATTTHNKKYVAP
jgi:hypothetical protein